MKRDPRLARLSEEHHHGLVFARRIKQEVPHGSEEAIAALYAELLRFWTRGLLPHFHTASECLLARLIRHRPLGDPQVRKMQDEHLAMAGLVARMKDCSTLAERREALTEFGATLAGHIRWEERELFETAQHELTEQELDAMGEEILERHAKPTRAPWDEA